jgi:hypothetical protein
MLCLQHGQKEYNKGPEEKYLLGKGTIFRLSRTTQWISEIHCTSMLVYFLPWNENPFYSIMALQPFVGPLFHFSKSYTLSAGLFGRWISPSPGCYLHTEHHKHRINAQTSMPRVGFKPTTSSVWAGEDSSCLRPRGHCDRLQRKIAERNKNIVIISSKTFQTVRHFFCRQPYVGGGKESPAYSKASPVWRFNSQRLISLFDDAP